MTFVFLTNYNLVPFLLFFYKLWQKFRRILQIAKQHKGRVSASILQCGEYIAAESEISGVEYRLYFVILVAELTDLISGSIWGIVIHEYDLIVILRKPLLKDFDKPVIHLSNAFLLAPARNRHTNRFYTPHLPCIVK